MELVLNNGFCNLSMDEMNLVNAGGWREFGYALGGTLLIAGAPIVAAAPGGRMDRSRWNAWHRNNNAW
ncbi:hypothetical protein [Agathobacter rectalis]|uniref:Uncharacterized protein n=1 Tax=Agathobacter rectalis TaxID=39491 RepID=A0AAW4UDA3_9FIRM|nr:hypothetical protein [Agathobacter rectalis]MCB6937488.1 hypothetical protein [Agathobacter rectalis]